MIRMTRTMRTMRTISMSRAMRVVRAFSFLGVFMLLTAASAFAQEGESPSDSSLGWVFRWLNFAIVLCVIVYAAVKAGGPAFRRRADEISASIGEAARAREAAEQQRRETRTKLANLDKEIEEMRAASKRDAEAEAKRLRDLARSEAEKIERVAQAEMAAAERASRLELKALAARLAIGHAEVLLRDGFSSKTDFELVDAFAKNLQESAN
jgi:F-type H+-transporting ATPase subunit b